MERQELQRRPTETRLEHIKRVVYGKLVNRTIDYDYSELAPYVYGRKYAPDVCRRMMYGTKFVLGVLDDEVEPGGASAGGSSKMLDDIRRETQKIKDQRRELQKLIRAEAREAHILDVVKESAQAVANKFPCDFLAVKREKMQLGDDEAILVLGDWHYGMVTNNTFNKYNTQVCVNRVEELIQKVSERISKHKCKTLHVMIIGDMIHGAIHTSARVASEERTVEQLMEVSEIIARLLIALSHNVDNVNVYTTYGNHARVVQNKKDSDHRDNAERLIGWWLRWRLDKHESITVCSESQNEFILQDVCGHGICACHGDLDGVKTSPQVLSSLFHKKHGKEIEYIILGDKHHEERFGDMGVTAEICGSLCGTDDYANEKRFYSPPSQLLLIVNKTDGVDAEYRIKLS